MSSAISSAFNEFKSNLEITGLQSEAVSKRQQNVRTAIEDGLCVLSSFLTGSYMRSTMIRPLSEADIDIFIVLDPQYYYQYNPASLLDKVKNVLLVEYPKTPKISRNGQAVTITFKDFVVDVVPAFNRSGGGYIIPSSVKERWIETDPKIHEDYFSTQNFNHTGKFIPIVKMLKAWNRESGKSIKSFYLELLAAKVFSNVTISDYPSGVRYFLIKDEKPSNTRCLTLLALEDRCKVCIQVRLKMLFLYSRFHMNWPERQSCLQETEMCGQHSLGGNFFSGGSSLLMDEIWVQYLTML